MHEVPNDNVAVYALILMIATIASATILVGAFWYLLL
jgi:hypothetical protein